MKFECKVGNIINVFKMNSYTGAIIVFIMLESGDYELSRYSPWFVNIMIETLRAGGIACTNDNWIKQVQNNE